MYTCRCNDIRLIYAQLLIIFCSFTCCKNKKVAKTKPYITRFISNRISIYFSCSNSHKFSSIFIFYFLIFFWHLPFCRYLFVTFVTVFDYILLSIHHRSYAHTDSWTRLFIYHLFFRNFKHISTLVRKLLGLNSFE